MSEIQKMFPDGSFLEYGRGGFDNWCVFLTNAQGSRRAIYDVQYFADLQRYGSIFGQNEIYRDFVAVYDMVGTQPRETDMAKISELAAHYGDEAMKLDMIFSLLYMTMISEQNKENTRLGKRIKRLGVYQLLMQGMTPEAAANFSKGKRWQQLSDLCREYGF